jgi:hypothetical protein
MLLIQLADNQQRDHLYACPRVHWEPGSKRLQPRYFWNYIFFSQKTTVQRTASFQDAIYLWVYSGSAISCLDCGIEATVFHSLVDEFYMRTRIMTATERPGCPLRACNVIMHRTCTAWGNIDNTSEVIHYLDSSWQWTGYSHTRVESWCHFEDSRLATEMWLRQHTWYFPCMGSLEPPKGQIYCVHISLHWIGTWCRL